MLKKLLILIGIFNVIITKSILIAKSINTEQCDHDLGRYSFNITALLNGNLTKSILENYTIENNNINNNLKIICKCPDVIIPVKNKNIEINCYTDNILLYNNLSISFKGINSDLDLINFSNDILHIDNIFCKKKIKLLLGDIKEQKCKQINLYYFYEYIIVIENKTIPNNIDLCNIDLKPKRINENIYNISCDLVNNDNNNYFKCSLFSRKKIDDLFYEKDFIYKKEINNYIIYIYLKNDLFIGKNIKCINNIKNNSVLKLRAMQTDTDENNIEETDDISDSIDNFETSNTDEQTNSTIIKNCIEYNDLGKCSKCETGYYLTGINNEQKCLKCLSNCEECKSLNNCSKCSFGYFIRNEQSSCISCFDKMDGCQECSSENKCDKCYTNLKYNLINGKCEIESNNINKDTKLKFQRFDSFEKSDNKVYFRAHFIVLNNYLSNTKLKIIAYIIPYRNALLRFLRKLNDNEKNITCDQYGNSLGNNNLGGYLANYICSIDGINNLESIQPKQMEIINNNNIIIQQYEYENLIFKIKDLESSSLDEEYNSYEYIKITISSVSSIKLKNELSFNIIGDSDQIINKENTYEILLKNKDSKDIITTCTIPKTDTQNNIVISCVSPKNEINEKNDELKIEEGMYIATVNKEVLILNNKNNVDIKVNKDSLSVGAIIGITIAGIIVVVPFVFYLVRYLINKKDNIYENEDNENNEIRPPNGDNSKDIIFNHNY